MYMSKIRTMLSLHKDLKTARTSSNDILISPHAPKPPFFFGKDQNLLFFFFGKEKENQNLLLMLSLSKKIHVHNKVIMVSKFQTGE